MAVNTTQKTQLESVGCGTAAQAAQAEAIVGSAGAQALGLDWAKLIALIQEFGPVILAILAKIFNVPTGPVVG